MVKLRRKPGGSPGSIRRGMAQMGEALQGDFGTEGVT